MQTHEQLVAKLMRRPGVRKEVERIEREEGALLDTHRQYDAVDAATVESSSLGKMPIQSSPFARMPTTRPP